MFPSTSGNFVTLLLRRKLLILLSGVVLSVVAFGLVTVLPLTYTSEGSLIVDSRVISASSDNSAVVNDVLTEVDVLQSVGLIRRAIQDYKLTEIPDLIATLRLPAPVNQAVTSMRQAVVDWWHRLLNKSLAAPNQSDLLVAYIQKHLDVAAGTGGKKLTTTDKNSSVISIKFTAGSPDAAALVVNAMIGTYLTAVHKTRDAQIASINRWFDGQTKMHQKAVLNALQAVSDFTSSHNMAEVQGSLTAAMQLARDQDQLGALRQELAKEQAAVETLNKNGAAAAQETLESKTIQSLKEHEASVTGLIATLTATDPRRAALQSELGGIKSMITEQNNLIVSSLPRSVLVTQARIKALEAVIRDETPKAAQAASEGTWLKQLTGELEARRGVYMAFLTQVDHAKFASEQDATAHILFDAEPPLRPDRSMSVMGLVLGFFGGMLGTSGVIITRAYFNTRITSIAEMELATGLPVFGTLPDLNNMRGNVLAISIVTETFRAMWVAMRSPPSNQPVELSMTNPRNGISIVVTSSDAEEGKTTVAIALAQRFAADGFCVLLIDADLRRPRLAQRLKLSTEYSLESVMDNSATLDKAIVPLSSGLDCMLSNGQSANPVKVLTSDYFAEVVGVCRARYDFVIFDSPPAARVSDPVLLAKLAQHIVFIAQAGRTPNLLAGEATKRFPNEDRAKMLPLLIRVRELDLHAGYGAYGS